MLIIMDLAADIMLNMKKVDYNMKTSYHSIYVLTKNGKAVYIGCAVNVKRRINEHKKTKEFDSFQILKHYKSKEQALIAENALITFLTLFGDGEWYNSEDILLSYERDFKLRKNG